MSTFFIPKQIKVGYQKREDTFTEKLAYVIYYDQKGELRKENSWQSWRDKTLGDDTFVNDPISGFVLNKHAGGYSSGWNHRQSYCRVYDPRGFEIEITIDNLLWILDWVDCYKGKGLDGKFCYGWVGTDLVLIPECTEDYQESKTFSDSLFKKPDTKKSDLVVGSSYKFKDGSELAYVGEFKIQNRLGTKYFTKSLFINPDKKNRYDKNKLYPKSSSSILVKVLDNVIDKEEIEDIKYRFSLTAYSMEFWNSSSEFIECFIPNPGKCSSDRYADGSLSWDAFRVKRIILSDDKNSLTLYKGYEYLLDSRYYTRSYILYPFIKIDKSGRVLNKFHDIGKAYTGTLEYPNAKEEVVNEIRAHRDYYKNECINYGCGFIYKTKDGYYSDSLEDLIKEDNLSYISDCKNIPHFKLPIKDIKEI